MLAYRRDIDGLRAIAVMAVVLYHADIPGFSGGFVGVDVFFVISGYLITSLLLGDLSQGQHSLAAFYERRIRRIFPPLFAMLAATYCAGYVLLLPGELAPLARSLLEATFFGSNIGFAFQAGYFEPAAETKPLLHTWSLCVEEQFYVVFPLLLALLWRRQKRALPWLLIALGLGSFAWSVWELRVDPDAAFYLSHLRAWELLLGAVVATGIVPPSRNRYLTLALSTLGLGAITYAIVAYDATIPFPGTSALLPTLGTALLIHAESANASLVSRVLGHRLPVAIGLISYALYLWHWPILVFARIVLVHPLRALEVAVALGATTLLAVGSRYLLEEPVRRRRVLLRRRALFAFAGTAMAGAALLAWPAIHTGGLPSRVPPPILAFLQTAQQPWRELKRACLPETRHVPKEVPGAWACEIGGADAPTTSFVVWGDSHAGSLASGIGLAAHTLGERGTLLSRGRCAPVLGVRRVGRNDPCVRYRRYAKRVISSAQDSRTVILVGHWHEWLGTTHGSHARPIALQDDQETAFDEKGSARIFARGFERTLRFLKSKRKRIVVVASVPQTRQSVPETLARVRWLGLSYDLRPRTAEYLETQRPLRGILSQLRERYTFQIVAPHEALCTHERCAVTLGSKPLYLDDHHLAPNAAPLLAPLFEAVL